MENEELVFCLKISQKQWIEKLQSGSAWFGAINNYIKQAEDTNNNEQGDRYEGVFARCKKESPTVKDCQSCFGGDLELIDDGEYYLLRRKTSRFLYAFCMYGIKNTDLQIVGDIDYSGDVITGSFRYDIDPKMYDGFLQDGSDASEVAGYYCSAGHINGAIETALKAKGYQWKRNMIQYDIDLSEEFYIDPGPDYPELWHKRKDLSYQHEIRFVLFNANPGERGICINFEPVSINSGNIAIGELYLGGTAVLREIAEDQGC